MRDYFWAFGTAVSWAVVPNLAKLGVSTGDFPPITGAFVAMAISLPLSYLLLVQMGKIKDLRELDRRSIVYLLLGGLASALGTFCYYWALSIEWVSLVSVLSATFPLFTVALAFVIFRIEKISWYVIGGVLLTTFGVFLLT